MANEQPRRPPTAYFLWLSANREDIAKSLGTSKGPEVSKEAGKLWKQLTEDDKKPFGVRAKALKLEYDKKMNLFKAQGGVVTKKRPFGDDLKEAKPRRPVGGGFGCYLAAKRSEIAKTLPEGHKMTDVGKVAGEMWRGLKASEKKPYEEEYVAKLAEYREAKEAYDAEHEGLLDLVALAKPCKIPKSPKPSENESKDIDVKAIKAIEAGA
eukprot:Skav224113  [mRNA]  locus=scaffold2427:136944:137573:- [translate_table: standard]